MLKKFILFVLLMNVVPFVYHNRFLGVHAVKAADVFDDEDGEDDGGDDGGDDGDDGGCTGQASSETDYNYSDWTSDDQGDIYADQYTTATDACGNSTTTDNGQVLLSGPTDTGTAIVAALAGGSSLNDATPVYTLQSSWTDASSGNAMQVNIVQVDFFSLNLFFSYCTWSAFFTDTTNQVGGVWKFTSQASVKYASSRRTQGTLVFYLTDKVDNIVTTLVETDLLHCDVTMAYDVSILYTVPVIGSGPYYDHKDNVRDVIPASEGTN